MIDATALETKVLDFLLKNIDMLNRRANQILAIVSLLLAGLCLLVSDDFRNVSSSSFLVIKLRLIVYQDERKKHTVSIEILHITIRSR
jgi:hypothetical protein